MKEIITWLFIWLGTNTYFNTNHPHPTVLLMPQEEMNRLYYQDNDHEPDSLHGLYDKSNDTIILPDDWNKEDPFEMSVLLHELVHYLQDVNGMEFKCTREMEKDAWPIQQSFLKQVYNYDWNYDKLWYLMISSCSDPFNF